MKIYFTAAIAKTRFQYEQYEAIIRYLNSLNCTVFSGHITDPDQATIDNASRQTLLKLQAQIEHWISECDFMVANALSPSISVGYEISQALRLSKPVLVFYGKSGPPSLLRYHKSENLQTEPFSDDTFRDAIDIFIKNSNVRAGSKFIFLITPKIADFLDQVAKVEKIPKSVYIRRLIEQDMDNHFFE